MADMIPNATITKLMGANIDLDTDTIKAMLLTDSHTQNRDSQEFIDDVSSNEVAGAGYTAGGATLSGKSLSTNNSTDKGVFDASDLSWTTATISARYLVLYKDTGTPSTSPIIQIIDFGEVKSSTAGNFNVNWNASGILLGSQA